MADNTTNDKLIEFENDNFDALVEQHFPSGSWYSSDSLITQYPDDQKLYSDIYPIYGSEEFEKKYGCDPIGCIYETHGGKVLFASYG